jgi:sec-independent protein translocase protein TatC
MRTPTKDKGIADDREAFPFWTHVEELRRALIRVFSINLVGVLISFIFYAKILAILTAPFTDAKDPLALYEEKLEHVRLVNPSSEMKTFVLPQEAFPLSISQGTQQIDLNTYTIEPGGYLVFAKKIPQSAPLVILGPLEGILIALKTSLWVGAVATSPFWLFVLLQFIVPALYSHEKSLIWPFLCLSFLFIGAGFLFAFLVTIPIANQYLASFNTMIGTNLWSLTHYLDYTLFLLLANGLAFELSVVGIFAVHLGLVSSEMLSKKRRIAYVLAFVIGALLTPPDVVSQVMLAIPLIVLYEVILIYARLKKLRLGHAHVD